MDAQYKWCKTCNFTNWTSGNDEIDNFIQLKINKRSDTMLELIPFNKFNKIKKRGKGDFVAVYSATWAREDEVALLCFNDLHKFLIKV
jgi:hypothetical protein